MARLIEAENRTDAWLQAICHLLENGTDLNLTLAIKDPATNGPFGQGARRSFDNFFAQYSQFPMHTVAETIFPGWIYRKRGIEGVLKEYPKEIYPAIKKNSNITWGTYAYRLTERTKENGEIYNPLEDLITKLKREKGFIDQNKSAVKSSYEANLIDGMTEIPLHSSEKDRNKRIGAPCLSHLSFKLFKGQIHLSATYRSHDYGFKVPGNLLGLARLQACVAKEVNLPIGELFIHSTYAYFDCGKIKLRNLVKEIRSLSDS